MCEDLGQHLARRTRARHTLDFLPRLREGGTRGTIALTCHRASHHCRPCAQRCNQGGARTESLQPIPLSSANAASGVSKEIAAFLWHVEKEVPGHLAGKVQGLLLCK